MSRQPDALCQVRFLSPAGAGEELSPITKRVIGSVLYKKQYYDCSFVIPSQSRAGWPCSIELSLLTAGVKLVVGEEVRLFRGRTLLAEGKVERVLR